MENMKGKPEIIVAGVSRCEVRESYYEQKFAGCESVQVSDRTPNYAFQPVEETGWKEVEAIPEGYTGKVFYKNASLGGRSRTYIVA